MTQGIQRDKRTTFGAGELNISVQGGKVTTAPVPKIGLKQKPEPAKEEPKKEEPTATPAQVEKPIQVEVPVQVETPAQVEEPAHVEAPAVQEPAQVTEPVHVEESVQIEAPIQVEEPIQAGHALAKLANVTGVIPYFRVEHEDTEMTTFWQMWQETLPSDAQIVLSIVGDFTWIRAESAGSKDALDALSNFFLAVGSPQSEDELMKDLITELRPTAIGSWIDASKDGTEFS